MEISWETLRLADGLQKRQHGSQPLTPREREVLVCLLSGASEKEVAAQLSISQQTVHAHVKSLYRACGVSSRPQLMARWLLHAMRALKAAQQLQQCACARA